MTINALCVAPKVSTTLNDGAKKEYKGHFCLLF